MENNGRTKTGRFAKGSKAGRPKGAKGKLPKDVANQILEAWKDMGGKEHMVEWGKSNPDAFYSLLARLLPKEVKLESHATHEVIGLSETMALAEEAAGNTVPLRQLSTG